MSTKYKNNLMLFPTYVFFVLQNVKYLQDLYSKFPKHCNNNECWQWKISCYRYTVLTIYNNNTETTRENCLAFWSGMTELWAQIVFSLLSGYLFLTWPKSELSYWVNIQAAFAGSRNWNFSLFHYFPFAWLLKKTVVHVTYCFFLGLHLY